MKNAPYQRIATQKWKQDYPNYGKCLLDAPCVVCHYVPSLGSHTLKEVKAIEGRIALTFGKVALLQAAQWPTS